MADFERAKAYLQRKQGTSSLYDHLSEVLMKIVTEEPADSLALFEHLSSLVKRGSFPGDTTGSRAGGQVSDNEVKLAESDWSSRAVSLFAAPEAADGVSPGTQRRVVVAGEEHGCTRCVRGAKLGGVHGPLCTCRVLLRAVAWPSRGPHPLLFAA